MTKLSHSGAASFAAMACLLLIPAATSAQTETALRGKMFIAGKTVSDPPPNEAKNTHAYVTISGNTARRMYRSMRGRIRPNECLGDGWKMKTAGPLICSVSRDGKKATCDFAISLVNGRSKDGQPC
jgi:hypothetical protein